MGVSLDQTDFVLKDAGDESFWFSNRLSINPYGRPPKDWKEWLIAIWNADVFLCGKVPLFKVLLLLALVF